VRGVHAQRDVLGITRSAVPILVGQGIQAVTVGTNGGCAPPAVPHNTPFRWRDEQSGTELLSMWHPGEGSRALLSCNLIGLSLSAQVIQAALAVAHGSSTLFEALPSPAPLATEHSWMHWRRGKQPGRQMLLSFRGPMCSCLPA
jgi:hypothetical protein